MPRDIMSGTFLIGIHLMMEEDKVRKRSDKSFHLVQTNAKRRDDV